MCYIVSISFQLSFAPSPPCSTAGSFPVEVASSGSLDLWFVLSLTNKRHKPKIISGRKKVEHLPNTHTGWALLSSGFISSSSVVVLLLLQGKFLVKFQKQCPPLVLLGQYHLTALCPWMLFHPCSVSLFRLHTLLVVS